VCYWHVSKTNAIRAITHVSAEGLESATRYIAGCCMTCTTTPWGWPTSATCEWCFPTVRFCGENVKHRDWWMNTTSMHLSISSSFELQQDTNERQFDFHTKRFWSISTGYRFRSCFSKSRKKSAINVPPICIALIVMVVHVLTVNCTF